MRWSPDPPEVAKMCHDWWMRRERRREERFDEELTDPERLGVEAGTRA